MCSVLPPVEDTFSLNVYTCFTIYGEILLYNNGAFLYHFTVLILFRSIFVFMRADISMLISGDFGKTQGNFMFVFFSQCLSNEIKFKINIEMYDHNKAILVMTTHDVCVSSQCTRKEREMGYYPWLTYFQLLIRSFIYRNSMWTWASSGDTYLYFVDHPYVDSPSLYIHVPLLCLHALFICRRPGYKISS